MREASSRTLIADLLGAGARGARLRPGRGERGAQDLRAARTALEIVDSALAALEGADALAVVTEWQEFRSPDFAAIKARLKTPAIFDGRNLYDPQVRQVAWHSSTTRSAEKSKRVKTKRADYHRRRGVLVVGDVMLDRYWFGDVSRISPEAPVPVVLIRREEERLGGAANVAWNCKALGAQHAPALGGRHGRAGRAARAAARRRRASRRACTATPSSTPRRSCA